MIKSTLKINAPMFLRSGEFHSLNSRWLADYLTFGLAAPPRSYDVRCGSKTGGDYFTVTMNSTFEPPTSIYVQYHNQYHNRSHPSESTESKYILFTPVTICFIIVCMIFIHTSIRFCQRLRRTCGRTNMLLITENPQFTCPDTPPPPSYETVIIKTVTTGKFKPFDLGIPPPTYNEALRLKG